MAGGVYAGHGSWCKGKHYSRSVAVVQRIDYNSEKGGPMPTSHPRITMNPAVLAGKPTVRGMRISVEQIFRSLSSGVP
jgi:hypothetical protein